MSARRVPSSSGVAATVAGAVRLGWRASSRAFVSVAVVLGIEALFPAAIVWVSKRFIDLVAAGNSGARTHDLARVALALGGLTALQRVVERLSDSRREVFASRVSLDATQRLVEAVSRADLARFDDPAWHDRVSRASREMSWRPYQLLVHAMSALQACVTIAGMLGILFGLHPVLLVLAVVSVLVPLPFERATNRRLYEFYFNETPKEREQSYVQWLLTDGGAAKEVRAFTLEDHLRSRHLRLGREMAGAREALLRVADRRVGVGALGGGIALAGAYVFLGTRGAEGVLTAGAAAAVIGAVASVTGNVARLSSSLLAIEQQAAFVSEFFDLEASRPEIVAPANAIRPVGPLRGGIRFRNVTFLYPGSDARALDGLDLEIRDGELIALVGENGAGKTTLVKLLLRFYDASEGSVEVGGADVRRWDPADLRGRIGVLFQDYQRYSLTLRENVGFGRVERASDDARVRAALEVARAEDLASRLPQGLDGMLGRMFDGGTDLSGGQWQRLALARLVFRDADIWILDEPTAALDPEAEAAIFGELKQQLRGRVGIVISHRYSTVRAADRIAVIAGGRVAEIGTHDELIASGGRYAELFEMQAAGYR